MLEYLANGEKTFFSELAEHSPAYAEHLIGYGIVVRRGSDFEFTFDAVAGAVKASTSDAKPHSREQKRQEISRRRNIVEEEIRSFLYRTMNRLDQDAWLNLFHGNITAARKSQLGVLSRREAFSKTKSPLYFVELLKLIQSCGELDNTETRLTEILSAMNVVNTARIDAHAKDISDNEFAVVTRALELLENVFVPP
jgi:hypothetical protein